MSEDATTQPDDDTTQPAGDAVPDRFVVDFSGLTLLGIYRIERKLADGGMGSVYLGTDTNLGRNVVVKVPHVRFLGERGFRSRFTREITELVRLEHPHIVRILAQGERDGVPFFVLQFLGGGSLETRLTESPTIPAAKALPWFRRIAETLDFVHERNTVHRDVKPANILFDETGHVYLSDFGVAKALDNQDANVTDAGTGIGSPRYMSPEQGYGRDLGPSADQYALGASLYETLAGQPPHGEGSAVELLVRKAREDPEPLSSMDSSVPQAASDAVARAMSREPADRFPSCRAFVEAVERAFGLGTGEVTGPVAVPAAHRRIPPWMALGLVAVAGGLGFWAVSGDDEPTAPVAQQTLRLDHSVRLLDIGQAPHRVLRYEIGALKEPFHVRVKQYVKTKTVFPDQPDKDSESNTDLKLTAALDCNATSIGPQVGWEMHDVEVAIDSPKPVEAARAQALRSTRGMKGTFRTDAFGARLTEEANDEEKTFLQRIKEQSVGQFMHDILVPLPRQAIGVGARWEVVETVEVMNLRLLQTAIYELKRIEGGVLFLTGRVSQAAPAQEFPAVAGSPQTRLVRLNGGGTAEAEIRLDRAAPLVRRQDFQIEMVFDEVPNPDGGKPGRSTMALEAQVWAGSAPHTED